MPHVIIGGTTNILFSDDGLAVPCIQIGHPFNKIELTNIGLRVDAGAWVPNVARRAMAEGFGALTHTCGIPGTLGGLICMNGGSLRRSIGDCVEKIVSIDESGHQLIRNQSECGFGYRKSCFQENGELVAEVHLSLRKDSSPAAIRREMLTIMKSRRHKFPRKLPNCGSVFVSDPETYTKHGPPGALIEELGFKGRRKGGAEISRTHANFIVNIGSASSADILELICEITTSAQENLGVRLRAEVQHVDSRGTRYPANAVPMEAIPSCLRAKI